MNKKMNKKGFTLIELLAVIVILAIIALIAIPMILGVISKTKKGAAVSSAYGYIDSVEKYLVTNQLSDGTSLNDGTYDVTGESLVNIKLKGTKPTSGTLAITKGKITSGTFVIDGYTITFDGIKATILENMPTISAKVSNYNLTGGESHDIATSYFDISYSEGLTGTTTCKVGEKTVVSTSELTAGAQVVTCTAKNSKNKTASASTTITVTYAGFSVEEGVNTPVLTAGMTPIKWDSNNNEVTTTVSDPDWYDYSNKKWANAKTADGSYWVWIPRYAYKISSGYHSSTVGTIDIKFLMGTTSESYDKTSILSSGYVAGTKDTSTNYFVHPSFNFVNEVLGYWVAKFEATASEGVANSYTADGSCSVTTDNVTTKTVKIIPNATSWRCINNSTIYSLTLAMKSKAAYGWTTSSIDTHLIKNTEWGAVAYLSKSIYGANDEVWINNSSTSKTGCAGSSVSAASYAGCQNAYNTATGIKASTTYNITGVYDMSGGNYERTMAVYNNLPVSSGFTAATLTAVASKYVNRYTTGTLLNSVGMDYDTTIYGDAMYETSNGAARHNGTAWVGSGTGSWYTDSSNIPLTTNSWFIRGGGFDRTTGAGVFSFGTSSGNAGSGNTFRPVVIVN